MALLSNIYVALAQVVRRVQHDAAGIEGNEDKGYDDENYDEFEPGNQGAFLGGGSRQQKPEKGNRSRRQSNRGRSRPPVPPPPPPPAGFEGGENGQYLRDEQGGLPF